MKKRSLTEAEFEQAFEDLCDGCGKCCNIASMGGKDTGVGVACPSLDTTTNRCMAYEDRHNRETCLKVTPDNIAYLHTAGILPTSCAYVQVFVHKKRPPPPFLVERAKLVPFNLADVDLQKNYILKREEWLSNVSGARHSHDDQPTSCPESPA